MRLALGLLIALAAAAPAAAQQYPADTATPDGSATLYGHWTGARTMQCDGPRSVVAFTVRVGPGSRVGRVRLRIVRTEGGGLTGVRSGGWVDLPATPGDHRFATSVHLGACQTDEAVALEQETGGHVIVHRHPPGNGDRLNDRSLLNELWTIQPAVADGQTVVPDRHRAQDLQMGWDVEADLDRDGLGDATQDPTPGAPYPPVEPPPPQPGPPPEEPSEWIDGPDVQRPLLRGAVLVRLWSRTGGRARVTVRIAPGITLRRWVTLAARRETTVRVRLTAAARRALRERRRTAAVTAYFGAAEGLSWRTRLRR